MDHELKKALDALASALLDNTDDALQAVIQKAGLKEFAAIDFYNEGLRAVIAKLKLRLEGGV